MNSNSTPRGPIKVGFINLDETKTRKSKASKFSKSSMRPHLIEDSSEEDEIYMGLMDAIKFEEKQIEYAILYDDEANEEYHQRKLDALREELAKL